MSTVLYRKYRPQTFAMVTNQRAIVRTLTNELRTNRLGHAYCFSGPRGVGKTSIARLLARAANCTARKPNDPEPCNECEHCRAMLQGYSLDLIEIDAASNTGVDNVRDNIIASSRVASAGGAKKVFIIDEAHMLSLSAFNALLKTLEEPPEHVLFILATTEIHKLPATILSRCQRFHFERINRADMLERLTSLVQLEGRTVGSGVLDAIVSQSEGSLRDAETLLGQVLTLESKGVLTMDIAELVLGQTVETEVLALGGHLGEGNTEGAMKVLYQFEQDGGDPLRLFDAVVELLRLALICSSGLGQSSAIIDLTASRRAMVEELSRKKGSAGVLSMLDHYIRRRSMVATANDPMVPLMMATVESTISALQAADSLTEAFVDELQQ